jgi:phage terminase large subunit GpA
VPGPLTTRFGAQQTVEYQPPVLDTIEETYALDHNERTNRRTPFIEWALRVPEPKSGTLDFDRFPFQRELYEEGADEKEMVVAKATQIGISAWLTRWVMYHADVRGLIALYVFPKLAQMYDFADARVKEAILGSEYLRSRVPPTSVQNKGLRKIGLGLVYFRGSETKTALDSVDADVLALDEYDTLTQENIPDAEKRISGSDVGLIRRVGVPSIPNWGIDRLYQESDMRRWMVKCGACRNWQDLRFPENVDLKRAVVVCSKCRKDLDVTKGEWVPEHPDRDVRGYHIPRLVKPATNVAEIIKASKATNPTLKKTHFNKDLGLAYADEQGRLSDEAIAAACRAYSMAPRDGGARTDNLVTMGVDVASARALNVRISEHFEGERKRALWIGRVDNYDDLADLMRRFDVNMCAIDHAPEERMSRRFANKFPGRVYLVTYAPNATQVFKVDDEMKMASVRRVEAIDATYDLIRRQLNELPGGRNGHPEALPEGYKEELQGEVRESETDEFGKVTVRYRKTGPNDYTHAEVYDVVATECWFYRQTLDEETREVFQPLDEMLEFERTELEDPDAQVYDPGFRDEEYSPGFEG